MSSVGLLRDTRRVTTTWLWDFDRSFNPKSCPTRSCSRKLSNLTVQQTSINEWCTKRSKLKQRQLKQRGYCILDTTTHLVSRRAIVSERATHCCRHTHKHAHTAAAAAADAAPPLAGCPRPATFRRTWSGCARTSDQQTGKERKH